MQRRLTRSVALGVLLLGACGESTPASPLPPMPAESAETPEAEAPTGPQPVTRSISVARFDSNDQLSNCADNTITVRPRENVGGAWPPDDEMWSSLAARMAGENTLLRRSCGEQFPHHPALATCAAVMDDETERPTSDEEENIREAAHSIRVETTEFFYGLRVLENDAQMRQCLEIGGEWTPVAPDSPEAARAHLSRARRTAEELRQLGR